MLFAAGNAWLAGVKAGEIPAADPSTNLGLSSTDCPRDPVATAEEVASLIAAQPAENQALWATAFYAGLRCGELRDLRWCDIDDGVTTIRESPGRDRF